MNRESGPCRALVLSYPHINKIDSPSLVYCKRGYFCWGKISRKCWQDISRGSNFHVTTPISFIKVYGFYFCPVGVYFAKKGHEKRENYPHPKISTFKVADWLTVWHKESHILPLRLNNHFEFFSPASWEYSLRPWTYLECLTQTEAPGFCRSGQPIRVKMRRWKRTNSVYIINRVVFWTIIAFSCNSVNFTLQNAHVWRLWSTFHVHFSLLRRAVRELFILLDRMIGGILFLSCLFVGQQLWWAHLRQTAVEALCTEHGINLLKPRCWEPPGHYLCVPEPGRPGCVIAIVIGVKTVIATSADRRLARKHSFPLYIFHRRGLRLMTIRNLVNGLAFVTSKKKEKLKDAAVLLLRTMARNHRP